MHNQARIAQLVEPDDDPMSLFHMIRSGGQGTEFKNEIFPINLSSHRFEVEEPRTASRLNGHRIVGTNEGQVPFFLSELEAGLVGS